jgi:hypothetical protein
MAAHQIPGQHLLVTFHIAILIRLRGNQRSIALESLDHFEHVS